MTKAIADIKIGGCFVLGDGRPYWRISKYKISDGIHIYQVLNIYNIKVRV
jgi:hypothetical protein